jgi:hypothetical protein
MKSIHYSELSPITTFDIAEFAKRHNLQCSELEDFFLQELLRELSVGSIQKSEYCQDLIEKIEENAYDEGYLDGQKSPIQEKKEYGL